MSNDKIRNPHARIIEEGFVLKRSLENIKKYQPDKFKLLELKMTSQLLNSALEGINSQTWVTKVVKVMEDKINFDFRTKLVRRAVNKLRHNKIGQNNIYDLTHKQTALRNINDFESVVNILNLDETNLSNTSVKIYGAYRKTQLKNIIEKKQFTDYKTIEKLVILAAYKFTGSELPQLVPIRDRTAEYEKSNNRKKTAAATTPDKKPLNHSEVIENTNGFKLVEKTKTSADNQKLFSNFDAGSKALIELYLSSGADSSIIDPFKRMDLVLRLLEALKFDSGTFKGIAETIAGEQVDYQPDSLLTLNHLLDFNGGGK